MAEKKNKFKLFLLLVVLSLTSHGFGDELDDMFGSGKSGSALTSPDNLTLTCPAESIQDSALSSYVFKLFLHRCEGILH